MATSDSKPYGIIYCVTNKVNGKRYIGQTTGTLSKRWKGHISDKTGCRVFKIAIDKYGVENFSVCEIDRAYDKDSLNALETHYIKLYETRSRDKGYNLNPGGNSGPQHPETVQRRAAALRGRPLSKEHCEKLSISHIGIKRSDESRKKQSESAKGIKRPRTPEHAAKLAEAMRGKKRGPQSDEHRAKIGAANKGRVLGPMSEEQKQKRSIAMKGKPKNWSPEGRERTLQASRAYWEKYRAEKQAQQ